MCLGNRFFRPRKFWSPAPQGIFDSSGAPQGSIFWAHVWPGNAGFELLRARSACAPKGSKFRWGAAITHFWKGASHRGPLSNWSVPTNSGRSHSPHSIKWLQIGSPFRMGQPSRDTHQRPMFALHKIIELCFSRTLRALRPEKVEACVARQGRCVKQFEPSGISQGSRESRPPFHQGLANPA